MVSTVSISLQNSIKSFVDSIRPLIGECANIDKAYFATDASTLVGALPSGSSSASLDTKLTKGVYINGITMIEAFNNFFGNASVAQADYLVTIETLIYGNAASPAKLSDAAEDLANRLNAVAVSSLSLFNSAKDILLAYENSELSVLVSGATSERIIYGADMSVGQLGLGITLIEQFKKMINNEAVITGEYADTVAVWLSI